ncbi:MAG TPA: TonB-dependent receptor, partial [Sediminibacterium sp.]|nr:TonB-dependent receptor [Sediminibacterium sp.]
MKTKLWLLPYVCLSGLLLISPISRAALTDTTATFKVYGVCEQCKSRIEGALKTRGVSAANWDIPGNMLTVSWDPAKTSLQKINKKITAAGHDTYYQKATDEAYNALPKCCRYRDPAVVAAAHPGRTVANSVPEDVSTAIKGVVVQEDHTGSFKPLAGASVYWLGNGQGTVSDENGVFTIARGGEKLIISYAGFQPDTISVSASGEMRIVLASGGRLREVQVSSSQKASYISSFDILRTQHISQKELFKAACCNLSESFETNPSVDVSYNDAVTGSKQLQLLGLAGVYTQLTVDNLPGPRGLATPFGLNFIPGTWIESMQLSKGTGSVANGFESIAGQINVELKKPGTAEKVYANIYSNDQGKTDLNLNLSQKINNQWSVELLVQDAFLHNRMDQNQDGFRDMPTGNLFTIANRWHYDNAKGLMSLFGVRVLTDDKTGGQISFNPATDKLTTNSYGVGIHTQRYEAFGKIGYVFPEKKYKSVGLQVSGYDHRQDAYFGLTPYNARQQNLYANLIYQSIISNTRHKFRTGLSFLYDHYDEDFRLNNYRRTESVPGVFFEYTYTPTEEFDIVAGVREDHHNLYGWFTTPKLNLRYQPFKHTVIRAGVGRGQRTANIFAENNSALVSARTISIDGVNPRGAYGLNPEIAWNKGLSIDQTFMLFRRTASLGIDFYRNDFTNQVVVDMEDPRTIRFYNLDGKSYSNSLQT